VIDNSFFWPLNCGINGANTAGVAVHIHSAIVTMKRSQAASIASTLLLSAAIVIWIDLFAFSKTVHLPAWTSVLPMPMMTPAYLAFICLIPAAVVASSLKNACVAVTKSVLLSPLAAMAAYALNPAYQDRFLPINLLFNYVWIVLFNCLLPAMLLVGARAAFHYALKYRHG
jgi:hypothetical protein